MIRFIIALLAIGLSTPLYAQVQQPPFRSGTFSAGNCPKFTGSGQVADGGYSCASPTQGAAGQKLYAVETRPPTITDDTTQGYKAGDLWCVQALGTCWTNISANAGAAAWLVVTLANAQSIGNVLPLDAPGVVSSGAYGTMLMTRAPAVVAANKAIDVWRASDQTTLTVGWVNGFVDAAAADNFCLGSTYCDVTKVYDQSVTSGGALNSFDGTQTPGWLLNAPTVTTGGSGCTNGSQTFTTVGGTGTNGTFTGTVTGGVLSGALTVVTTGSYAIYLASPISTTGGGCSVQPTISSSLNHRAPRWTTNTINGHRTITFNSVFTAGNPQSYLYSPVWFNLPSGFSNNYRTTTMTGVFQPQTAIYSENDLMVIGTGVGHLAMAASTNNAVGVSMSNIALPTLAGRTSPAIWSFQTSATATAVGINNLSGSITMSIPSNVQTSGQIASGVNNRDGTFELLGMAVWNSSLSAAALTNVKASFALSSGVVPQTNDTLVLVGDSISYGMNSTAGNTWPKMAQARGYLNRPVNQINIGYPGGNFVGGAYDFTSNFSANWTAIYSANIPRIWVVVALGRNDLFNTGNAATVYTRLQAYIALLRGLGANIHVIVATILPETDVSIPSVPTYNALVRAGWNAPLGTGGTGGLGADALIDWAADPIWSSGSFTNYLVTNGPHPTDLGYDDMALTGAATLNMLLR